MVTRGSSTHDQFSAVQNAAGHSHLVLHYALCPSDLDQEETLLDILAITWTIGIALHWEWICLFNFWNNQFPGADSVGNE